MKNNTKKMDILRAYARVIEQSGIEGASLSAVARELGITQGLIFRYFENKEDLTNQLACYVAEKCERSYEKAWPRDGGLTKASFYQFVDYILRVHFMRRRSIHPKLYFALLYLQPRQKQVQESFCTLTDHLVEKISAQLALFGQAGLICCPDPRISARTLLCLADGILCYGDLTPAAELERFIAAQRALFFSSVGFVPDNPVL